MKWILTKIETMKPSLPPHPTPTLTRQNDLAVDNIHVWTKRDILNSLTKVDTFYFSVSDRDECTENLNSCPGAPIHCHNEVGSYTCVCPSGFQFDTNKLTCYSSNWISPPVIFSTPDDITYLARVEFNITMSLTSAHEFHDIMAIDFDPTGGAFFFSEINPQRIVM